MYYLKIELIQEFIKKHEHTEAKFCRLCDIPLYVLHKIYKHDYEFDVKYLLKIANFMEIDVEKLFTEHQPSIPNK